MIIISQTSQATIDKWTKLFKSLRDDGYRVYDIRAKGKTATRLRLIIHFVIILESLDNHY